ncbi:MAG: ABC transporter ATP-binding protein [Spirochaetales bacterium]|nr:ABC transporter ATP-binding protein [Spirochaetales bacterium]
MPLIKLDNVSKHYTGGDEIVKALDEVSMTIEKGDFVAVCGASGSGKSTLLNILGILSTPTAGSVIIDEIDVYALGTEKKSDFRSDYLGFIFQGFQLVPYLTACENVMLPLAITSGKNNDKRKKALDMLDHVGILNKAHKLPNQLSGGENQRVAIARALVNEPEILLADELTGNLDSKNSEEVMNLLVDLSKKGKTIIMVTHEKSIAQYAGITINLFDGMIKEKIQNGTGVLK